MMRVYTGNIISNVLQTINVSTHSRLTKQQYNLIHESVLPSAVSYWGEALRVRRTENKIRLNRSAFSYCPNNVFMTIIVGGVLVQFKFLGLK